MGEMNLDNLSSQYFDVLKELGNIGAGNATTALAQMIGTKVDMCVPQVRLLDFKDVGDMMGGAEQIMAGIYVLVQGFDTIVELLTAGNNVTDISRN